MIFSEKIPLIPALCMLLALFPVNGGHGAVQALVKGMNQTTIPAAQFSTAGKPIQVDIYVPSGAARGDVLVLPGWKFSRDRWYRETGLRRFADERGYRLIFPEMNITLYESRYFPETSLKWSTLPGGQWVREMLIPLLRQNHGLLKPGKRNFLLGLSTGGRGVALVHLQNPGLFTAGAALSGDFDQVRMPADRLMTRVYGPVSVHGERWETVDNPRHDVEKGRWTMPLYIGHGKRDSVVPFEQSEIFYRALKRCRPDLRVVFNASEGAGHDFAYWGSELKAVFDFYESIE